MIKIAILGYGTVGSGVHEVISKHHNSIVERAKEEVSIKYILDLRDFDNIEFGGRFVKDFDTILNDHEIKVIVEAIGGLHPAYEYVKESMLRGKSVVTSNKELVSEKGDELLEIARNKNVNFLFEASVGGGIPIIRPLSQCLAANNVIGISGILNGTTNFILTKMSNESMPFREALNLAQKLGYAERDPSDDVDGFDCCRKICILASLAYGKHIYPSAVYTKGISDITLEDIKYAKSFGGVIKLIGQAKKLSNGQIEVSVEPMLVSNESKLSNVDDVFNGILVRGDATGDVIFYGKGAGKLPTASAVVADVIDCIKHLNARKYLYWAHSEDCYVCDYEKTKMSMLVRVDSDNICQDIERIEGLFGRVKKVFIPDSMQGKFAFITPTEENWKTKKILKNSNLNIVSCIRVSDENLF